MAFREVLSLNADKTISIGGRDKKTGKEHPLEIEGYYLGKRETPPSKFSNGKNNQIYFLQTNTGNVAVWGKTNLDNTMKSVKPGTMIKIKYAGMTPTPKGDMHTFKVFQDPSNTIDVSGLSDRSEEVAEEFASVSGGAEEDYVNDNGVNTYGNDDEQEDEEPVVVSKAPSTARAAAERTANVNSMLAKAGKKVG